MKIARHWYFIVSFSLSVGAVIYCYLVYRAGQHENLQLGAKFLSGIPNYYFFYVVILPFITAGVVYLAFENKYIRFFGDLSQDLGDEYRAKVLRFRVILLIVAIIFSVLVTIQDAAEKSTALPPYSIDLGAQQNQSAARFFACQKEWIECADRLPEDRHLEAYLSELRGNGYSGNSASGFDSMSHWHQQSSGLYKLESFLSWIAALVVSLMFVEVFLFMIVKNYVKPATKSLVIWMVVLASLWFPTKMYSSWHSNLGTYAPPAILWFGIALLAVAILLVVFLKTERNDLYKFANVVTAIFSALIAWVSVIEPELIQQIIGIVSDAGLIYTAILSLIVMFSLYLVTDHFISNYEDEAVHES